MAWDSLHSLLEMKILIVPKDALRIGEICLLMFLFGWVEGNNKIYGIHCSCMCRHKT